ncbi:MAG: DUF2079 domain-containing protein [Dehalococcoidia bacterium]
MTTTAARAGTVQRTRVTEAAAARVVTGLAATAFIVYWLTESLRRWNDFETNAFDLAFFDQIIWNTAHGRWFETTFVPYNFAGQHFEPVLLLFAGAYQLGAGPPFLTGTQVVVVGLAALLLFEAGRSFGLRPLLAATIAVAFLLSPYVHRAMQFDFHPESMTAAPAFASLWAVGAGRPRLAAGLALGALLFKEDAVFIVVALGAVIAWRGHRRLGIGTAAAAVAWTAVLLAVLMPWWRDGAPGDLGERYADVTGGNDGAAAAAWLVTHPVGVARATVQLEHLWTATLFVVTSALAMLAAPLTLLLLVPGLALAVLSTHPPQSALELHYAAEVAVVAAIGVVIGARRLSERAPSGVGAGVVTGIVAAVVLAPAVAGFLAMSPASLLTTERGARPTAEHRAAVLGALAIVPEGEAVAAQSGLAARLSQREAVDEFPGRWESSSWVVVDAYGFRTTQSIGAGFDEALARVRAEWERVYDRDGVEVFRRPGP